MTTPAINELVITQPRRPIDYRQAWNGVTGTWLVPNLRVTKQRVRPASSTSPIREDGTRAPLPWDHRWGHVDPPVLEGRGTRTSGGSSWILTKIQAPSLGDAQSNLLNSADRMAIAGGLPWITGNPYPFPSSCRNAAVTKLRLKILDDKADWGVTLGEMRTTVRGISSLCTDMVSFVDRLIRKTRLAKKDVLFFLFNNRWPSRPSRRMTPKQRIRAEKQITGRWLEFQFGIKPLLLDIEQSGEALSWLLFEENHPPRFAVKAGFKETVEGTWIAPWPTNGSFPTRLGESRWPLVGTARCHFSLIYELERTSTTTFQQLGLTNLAGLAWELTTFSWAVDYVLGVGDWLQSLVNLDGVKFVEGTESRIGQVTGRDLVTITPDPGVTLSGPWGRVNPVAITGRFQRVVLSDVPGPALVPSARNKLDMRRMANVLAAVSQLASAGR